jgi:integrase/recombinase XerD
VSPAKATKMATAAPLAVLRASRMIWAPLLWPKADRLLWTRARRGSGPGGLDNPATLWSGPTLKKNEDDYGRYLSWLSRVGLLIEDEAISDRITPGRLKVYLPYLKSFLSPMSVTMSVSQLCASAKAFAPDSDWSWLNRRVARLKFQAKPSREKRHAIRNTLELYNYGKELMDNADQGAGGELAATQRYQSGLIIALLAARPLRIRNFKSLSIGQSLRWDGKGYWLTFSADETKTDSAINEPFPEDLVPYLEAFIRTRRPFLLRRATGGLATVAHRSLWVDRSGLPMQEFTLRSVIKVYTKCRFGVALWPHLFRYCLLTSVAIDQPDLVRVSAALLGHTSLRTGEKHYNQARQLDASRQLGAAVSELRETFLSGYRAKRGGPKTSR